MWKEINSDEEFASLFKGAAVKRATTDNQPGINADLFWELSDGTWLAMKIVDHGGGCPTCGYGGGLEKTFFVKGV